jgi:hypothetical protein
MTDTERTILADIAEKKFGFRPSEKLLEFSNEELEAISKFLEVRKKTLADRIKSTNIAKEKRKFDSVHSAYEIISEILTETSRELSVRPEGFSASKI